MKCIAHRGYSIDRIDNGIDAIQEAVLIGPMTELR